MNTEVTEQARRAQVINRTIAELVAQAKSCLVDAKQIAEDSGMQYMLEGIVTDMINEVSDNQMWYGSDQSLC